MSEDHKQRPTLAPALLVLMGLVPQTPFVGCATALYGAPAVPDRDVDGDGYFMVSDGDCDDSDASIHPGADDPEGDGIDQNCDGVDGNASDTGT